jgi:hypothetical protein
MGLVEEDLEPSFRARSVATVSKPALPNCIQIWQNGRFRNWSMRFWRAPVLKPELPNGPLGLEFTTKIRVGVMDEPGGWHQWGGIKMAQAGEMRGSD